MLVSHYGGRDQTKGISLKIIDRSVVVIELNAVEFIALMANGPKIFAVNTKKCGTLDEQRKPDKSSLCATTEHH